jgi:hypothetical protein
VNLSPGLLSFELTFSFSRTVSTVPSGTVTVVGAGGAEGCVDPGAIVGAGAAADVEVPGAPPVDPVAPAVPVGAVADDCSGFLLHPATRSSKTIMAKAADFTRIVTSRYPSQPLYQKRYPCRNRGNLSRVRVHPRFTPCR